MRPHLVNRIRAWTDGSRLAAIGGLAALVAGGAALAAEPVDNPVLAEIERLEDLAARVRSARCEFTVRYVPTNPGAAEMMRAANLARAQSPDRYTLSRDEAGRAGYRAVWTRKGNLALEERTYASGKTLRFAVRANEVGVNLIQPYSFVFEYLGWPLSEWIRRASRREVSRGTVNGKEQTQIALVARSEDEPLIVLVFDDHERLASREIRLEERNYLVERSRYTLRTVARHEFTDHKAYDDGHGNTIWFPTKATLRYYVGETRDGKPVEKHAIEVEIEKLELNVDVDEALAGDLPLPVTGTRLDALVPNTPRY